MARALTSAELRRLGQTYNDLADELDAAEQAEEDATGRDEMRQAAARVTELEQRLATMEQVFVEHGIEPPGATSPPAAEPPVTPPAEPPSEPEAERRTRPGRRSGQAYNWEVNDAGEVVPLQMATIYAGDDEPDEVELPAEPDEQAA